MVERFQECRTIFQRFLFGELGNNFHSCVIFVAARAQDMAGVLMRFQSGYLYHYAFVMLVGVAGLVTYFMLSAR